MKHKKFIKSLQAIKTQLIVIQSKKTNFSSYTKKAHTQAVCSCLSSSGDFKYLYQSKQEVEYLLASKHIKLNAYPCPYEKGWHLTKN